MDDSDDDVDFEPPDDVDQSDTEILGEGEELLEELRNLGEDTTSCTCCTSCSRRKGKTGRPPGLFSSLVSSSGRQRRVTKRLKGVVCGEEADAILERLYRQFPSTRGDPVSHLSWVTLIKTLRLGYNQVKYLKGITFHFIKTPWNHL